MTGRVDAVVELRQGWLRRKLGMRPRVRQLRGATVADPTFTNLSGAPCLPRDARLIAHVLVPDGETARARKR